MQRLDLVAGWLDKVGRLPIGHPDRLRFLPYAEQVLDGPSPADQPPDSGAGGAPLRSGASALK